MGILTIYSLAESAFSLIEGGDPKVSSSIGFGELKVACGQVINSLLKTEYLQVNTRLGEKIPNGSVLALYENVSCETYNGKSKAMLPVKPISLPKNMGVWAIYPKYSANGHYELDKEFIPLQMGQGALLKSQPLINDLMGQVGYEVFGNEIVFTKDLKSIYPYVVLAIRMVIMDISLYGDYDPLPLPANFEWEVISQVYKMYSTQPLADKVVDSTVAENKNIPLSQQKQAP